MKPANQNEMDILLRSLARGGEGLVSARVAEEHLDADELNAFAEGLVTERARGRYSAHLAECANCRGIVVNLTQSAGLGAQRSVPQEETSPISFWQQLSALFSQPVLRFVLPAVLLVSIVGIGVIVLRPDRPGDFVAKHEPSQAAPNLDQTNQAVPSASALPTESTVSPGVSAPPTAVGTPIESRRGESAGTIAGVDASDAPLTMRKDADDQLSKATPTFAPDVAAPAPPPAKPAYSEQAREEPLAKQEAAKSEVEVAQPGRARTQTTNTVVDGNKAGTAARSAANQPKEKNVHGLLRERRASEDKDKSDTSERAETRTVSGKRFTRQNNSWIDSAYQQSRGTTNVKRGSEQYRALIGDEPGLRTFAEQLSGEVIVVWKGRAYKFY